MQLNIYFLILTFVIVLITIIMAKDLITGIMIITLLANFIMISINLSKTVEVTDAPKPQTDDAEESDSSKDRYSGDIVDDNDTPHIYGPEYDIYHKDVETYSTAYDDPKFPLSRGVTEAFQGIDAANTYMAQARARDKKCLDGLTAKTSDFYKHHYSNEFELEEAKRWWGNYEV